ncbi:hypothetical protein CYLTODRAFT_446112 [Cylindrobasidium torrendii FP15055 ss-10]|uniref:Lipid droplet-associated perilipin protein n=1 Tax=Cylindrobasidium torrendii FP15055 ss-10 TaxID=1314674 RepID=A0A0D7B269_9AGAR|nr:hypothetical protein CYLTODRAFT_446112 [Cylindrobasidium torrendii FP15055 ss-10]
MSKTEVASAPSDSSLPEFKALARFLNIPLISSSLTTVTETLASNVYTRSPYNTAKGISTSAYKYSEPIQLRFAPLITRADDYANKGFDVVESRYPSVFTTKPEDVTTFVRTRRESASKAIDERVRQPAWQVAQGIDERFTPVLNYVETAYTKVNGDTPPASPEEAPKYQYQRALALSLSVRNQVFTYSAEQLKQFQEHSALVKKASETSQSVSALASSSLSSAQSHAHGLSETMVAELQKLQASSAAVAHSLQESVHNSTSHLQTQIPPHVQELYSEFSQKLGTTVTDLRAIIVDKDIPLQEKLAKMTAEVTETVSPLLENLKSSVQELISRGRAAAPAETPLTNGVNGHAQ